MNCVIVPVNDPLVLVTYLIVYVLIVNCAVSVLVDVTDHSILVAEVFQSDQPLNVYHVLAIAVTAVHVLR